MAKARPCPKCNQFFNPKFFGQKWGDTIICSNCWVYEKIKFDNQNTPLANSLAPRNQGQHSLK